jgi:uncharacterized protein YjdB
MMLADNGSAWFISGAPDARWDNTDLHALTAIAGSNFEAVDVSPWMVSPGSGQAQQSSVTVSVSPPGASVALGAIQQFSATVTGNSNQSVTWDVNGIAGGSSTVGFIGVNGVYTAPAAVPSPATVIVHATSVAAPSASGSASVTIFNPAPPVSVAISPTSASVRTGNTKQFTVTVQNTSNTAVSWNVNGIAGGNSVMGTISSTGLYKAPAAAPSPNTVKVTAVSAADPTTSATAQVKITGK